MNPPTFMEEVPRDTLRVGDLVHYMSDLGGYRFGTVVTARKSVLAGTVAVLPRGRRNVEYVSVAKVNKAFRDVFRDKESP